MRRSFHDIFRIFRRLVLLLIGALSLLVVVELNCDRAIVEPRRSALAEEATHSWIAPGMAIEQTDAIRLPSSSTEIAYVKLRASGTAQEIIATIEKQLAVCNAKHRPPPQEPLVWHVHRSNDVGAGARKYASRNPPHWWIAEKQSGQVLSIDFGAKIYIPDAGGGVFVIYACH